MNPILDAFSRPFRSLRISVTDRCNLRCRYCMPEESYVWLGHDEILTFEETAGLTEAFTALGVEKIRLTGGEPLLRRDVEGLIRMLAANESIRDLAMTTNGILLAKHAGALRDAGLKRLTISLDTLHPERFLAFTRRDDHAAVLQGIEAAREAGFTGTKLNMVVMRGFNEDETAAMIEYGRGVGAEVRFIEYMDVGGATQWSMEKVVSRAEILGQVAAAYGSVGALDKGGAAPAERFALPDGTTFGIIASTTQPFCGECDRGRLTADGMWLLCLYARDGIDLKGMLRGGASREAIATAIQDGWRTRNDRGAEERIAVATRGILLKRSELQKDPHREMHTRGG